MSAQIKPFPQQPGHLFGAYQFAFGEGRTFILTTNDGALWWTDGFGGGMATAVRNQSTRRIELIVGPYKAYGAVFHASDDRPDIEAEAAQAMAAHLPRAATLPRLPDRVDLWQWSDMRTNPKGAA